MTKRILVTLPPPLVKYLEDESTTRHLSKSTIVQLILESCSTDTFTRACVDEMIQDLSKYPDKGRGVQLSLSGPICHHFEGLSAYYEIRKSQLVAILLQVQRTQKGITHD